MTWSSILVENMSSLLPVLRLRRKFYVLNKVMELLAYLYDSSRMHMMVFEEYCEFARTLRSLSLL
jgi:hypothetical protein